MKKTTAFVARFVVLSILLVGLASCGDPHQSLVLEPGSVVLAPGARQSFEVVAQGVAEDDIVWRASGGALDGNGAKATFIAPEEAGQYVVSASAPGTPGLSASASVHVDASAVKLEVTFEAIPNASEDDLVAYSPMAESPYDAGSGFAVFSARIDRASLVGVFDTRRGFGWTALWPSWFDAERLEQATAEQRGQLRTYSAGEAATPLSTAVQAVLLHPGIFHPDVSVQRAMTEIVRNLPEVRALADALRRAAEDAPDDGPFNPFEDGAGVPQAFEGAIDASVSALGVLTPVFPRAELETSQTPDGAPERARGVIEVLDQDFTRLVGADGGISATWDPSVAQLSKGVSWYGRAHQVELDDYDDWAELHDLWTETDVARWRNDVALRTRAEGSLYIPADPLWAWTDIPSLIVDAALPPTVDAEYVGVPNEDALYVVDLYSCGAGWNRDLRNTVRDVERLLGQARHLSGWSEACFFNSLEYVLEIVSVVVETDELQDFVLDVGSSGLQKLRTTSNPFDADVLTSMDAGVFAEATNTLLRETAQLWYETVPRPAARVGVSYLASEIPGVNVWNRVTSVAKIALRWNATNQISPWEGAVVQVGRPYPDSPEMVSLVGPDPSEIRLTSETPGGYPEASFTFSASGSIPLEYEISADTPWWVVRFDGAPREGQLGDGQSVTFNVMAQCPRDGTPLSDAFVVRIATNSLVPTFELPVSLECTLPTFDVAPVLDAFEAEPDRTTVDQPVAFEWTLNDLVVTQPVTCQLDADGDGEIDYTIDRCTSTDSRVFHYPEAGSYEAVLRVSNDAGEVQATAVVVVDPSLDTIEVKVTPQTAELLPEGTETFRVDVTGAVDPGVQWSSTCGTIDGTGTTITYTAPSTPGSCLVTATSVEDDTTSDSATVDVSPPPGTPTGDLTVEALNIDDVAVEGVRVRLFSDTDRTDLVATDTTDTSGNAFFPGLTPDTYYYDVSYDPGNNNPSTREYWGHGATTVDADQANLATFDRYMPYVTNRTITWDDTDNVFRATITVRNPGTAITTDVRLIGDRSRGGSYDLQDTAGNRTIAGDTSRTYTLTLTPPADGTYHWYYRVETSLFGATDQNVPWDFNTTATTQADALSDIDWISAGHRHSLAVRHGGVLGWGMNNDGELGDGTTTDRDLPVALSYPSTVVAIDGGSSHNLALLANGSLMAWGENEDGELGTTAVPVVDDSFSSSPVTVDEPYGDWIDVSAGAGQSAAVREQSIALFMWGRNYGVEPVRIWPFGTADLIDVELGQNHALALDEVGNVYAWGSNGAGELGTGDYLDSKDPIRVAGLPDIVDIAAGQAFSVALTSSGQVYAWGHNIYGQVGNGDSSGANVTSPERVPGLQDIEEVSAGVIHVVARRANGIVVAWGYNGDGRLGDGTTINRYLPTAVLGVEGAVQVSAGARHSLARLEDGTILSWGGNARGQLGDGTNDDRPLPGAVLE